MNEQTNLQPRDGHELKAMESFDLMTVNSFEGQVAVAKVIAESGMVPDRYKDNYQAVMVALQYGKEIGLPGMQALQSIYLVNGQPAVYGDGSLAICMRHPHWMGKEEPTLSKIRADKKATVTVYRKNCKPVTQDFSLQDAIDAGLYLPDGGASLSNDKKWKYEKSAWKNWWPRMLLWRARGFALRDQFADAFRGIAVAEEQEDFMTTMGEPTIVDIKEPKPADKGWFNRFFDRFKDDEPKEFQGTIGAHGASHNYHDLSTEQGREDAQKEAISEAWKNAKKLVQEKEASEAPTTPAEPEFTGPEEKLSEYDKEAALLGFISEAQRDEFVAFQVRNKLDPDQVVGWLTKHNIYSVNEIPVDKYDELFAEFKRVTGGS